MPLKLFTLKCKTSPPPRPLLPDFHLPYEHVYVRAALVCVFLVEKCKRSRSHIKRTVLHLIHFQFTLEFRGFKSFEEFSYSSKYIEARRLPSERIKGVAVFSFHPTKGTRKKSYFFNGRAIQGGG